MTAINTNLFNSQENALQSALPYCLSETHFEALGTKYRGKVRDTYDLGDRLLLITTDRQSAFDRHIATIPYKGQVLNLTSAWWFEETANIIPNHLIKVPDPNVQIAKKCDVFPIEFVVRGYITGSTNTSLWTQYASGVRQYCGIAFPDGLQKNEQLVTPVLTPTTKEIAHDRPISPQDIVSEGWMSADDFDCAHAAAMKLYKHGVKIAAKHGLILVDTKYEFGRDAAGNVCLVDEIHTPDSSRYWLKASYEDRMANHQEPDSIDKEFLRLWFKEHCDPYQKGPLPEAPQELVVTLASRYIQLYEMITGQTFAYHTFDPTMTVNDRIKRNILGFL